MHQERGFRVLHIAPTPFFSDRGCHIRIDGIVKALNRRNDVNLVCTYHHGRERPGVETRRIGVIRGYDKTAAGPDPFKYLADLKLLFVVRKCINEMRPDVIHAHLHEGVLIGWCAKWLCLRPRVPLVADIQGSLVGELATHGYFNGRRFRKWFFKLVEYVILRLPQHVFCSSVSSLALIRRDYKLKGRHVTLLCDRVDADHIPAPPAREVPAAGARLKVLYTGSLLPGKGLAELQQIILRLLQRRADAQVEVVGYPTEEITEFVTRNGLRDRVSMAGRVAFEDLHHYLATAAVGLDPKLAGAGEGSGKILNYMAAGLPVVAFDSPNNRAFLGEQQTLVADGSVENFVARIEMLMDDPDLRHIEGSRNQRRAREELSWDAGADLLRQTYTALTGK